MSQYIWLAITACVVYVVGTRLLRFQKERRYNRLYGTEKPFIRRFDLPWGLDEVAIILSNYKRQVLPEYARSTYERCGVNTFGFNMLGTYTIATREPRNVQAILATQFKDFGIGSNGRYRYGALQPLLGDGIFTLDGKGWEHSRALLRPQFSREQISHLTSLEEHVQILMQCIPEDGIAVDLQELFFNLTIDTATDFLFGESAGSLKATLRRKNATSTEVTAKDFADAFTESQDHCVNRFRLRDFYNWYNPPEFKKSNQICHDFVDKYVHKALYLQKLGGPKPVHDEKNGKEKYVFLEAISMETQDPKLLRDSLLNILLAGRDTTAGLLGFVFYLLVRYPEVEKKLRGIIKQEFGSEEDGEVITFEKLKNCTYLRWVINEVLRLYPAVPYNIRQALCDTTLPVGGGKDRNSPIFVAKGTNIEYSVYSMHRRTDIWGEDANWFRPERWGESRSKGHGGFEYLPFNGGPRICLGKVYAETEASYVIVRMFQRYSRFENGDLDPFVKCNATLTMSVGGKGTVLKCFRDA